MKRTYTLIAIAGLGLWIAGCDGSALQQEMIDDQMKTINDKVVNDSIDQYNITKSGTNYMDMCVNAGMVKAAMLQAKNDTGYNEWDIIEKEDCRKAGLPR